MGTALNQPGGAASATGECGQHRGTLNRWRLGRPNWIALALLSALALGLNTWGLSWGMPSVVSWAPDTVAGTRTLFTIGQWPERWTGHYPPLHFLINQAAYSPFLTFWQRQGSMAYDPDSGDLSLAPPVAPKVAVLIMTSRVITVIMSVLAAIALVFAAQALFDDGLSGLAAGLILATTAEWVFFSHLGNVDIPHMFWFALSLWAYVRAWRTDATLYFGWLGLLAALSISTKDAVAGAYAGMALGLACIGVVRTHSAGVGLPRSLLAIVRPKMLLGLATFLLPYAVIHGLLFNPGVYLSRMRYYLGGPGITEFNRAYEGPLWLIGEAFAVAAQGLGWPTLAVMLLAVPYALWRWPVRALMILVPAATYYLIVPSYTGMVYARMLFPVFLCLAILAGGMVAEWLRWPRVSLTVRGACVGPLLAVSVGYCAAVDLEMVHDTRYEAEQWLAQNVEHDRPVGVFSDPQYLPRFDVVGRYAIPLEMAADTFQGDLPEYLILTSHNYENFDAAQRRCMDELLAGEFGYEQAARFSKRYLPPRRRWFAIAGWATRGAGKVSPDILILKRVRDPHIASEPPNSGRVTTGAVALWTSTY